MGLLDRAIIEFNSNMDIFINKIPKKIWGFLAIWIVGNFIFYLWVGFITSFYSLILQAMLLYINTEMIAALVRHKLKGEIQ